MHAKLSCRNCVSPPANWRIRHCVVSRGILSSWPWEAAVSSRLFAQVTERSTFFAGAVPLFLISTSYKAASPARRVGGPLTRTEICAGVTTAAVPHANKQVWRMAGPHNAEPPYAMALGVLRWLQYQY